MQFMSIGEVEANARREGLSYGEYVAKYRRFEDIKPKKRFPAMPKFALDPDDNPDEMRRIRNEFIWCHNAGLPRREIARKMGLSIKEVDDLYRLFDVA